ncbi:MAG: hypothetical protein WBK48_02565 [Dethiobacteria bacterium]
MRIENAKVYGIEETIRASAFPMQVDVNFEEAPEQGTKRLQKLGQAKPGSGHDCALKGIVVQADVTAPQYWWLQFGRYHFADIVSSQSKMHRITRMNLKDQCNRYVDEEVRRYLEKLIETYNNTPLEPEAKKELFQRIIANTPMGLMLTARITTNYLQLKNMYYQRRNHKLEEWQIFCAWMRGLPYFCEFTGCDSETAPSRAGSS